MRTFFRVHFGGFRVRSKIKEAHYKQEDTPHGEKMSDGDKKKIMQVTLKSPNGVILMGSDHLDFMGGPFHAGE